MNVYFHIWMCAIATVCDIELMMMMIMMTILMMMMMMMILLRTAMIVMVIGVDVATWPARESASHPSLLRRDAIVSQFLSSENKRNQKRQCSRIYFKVRGFRICNTFFAISSCDAVLDHLKLVLGERFTLSLLCMEGSASHPYRTLWRGFLRQKKHQVCFAPDISKCADFEYAIDSSQSLHLMLYHRP